LPELSALEMKLVVLGVGVAVRCGRADVAAAAAQVVVLIGTGWSYMKPLLNDREKRILMIVIPLQVRGAVAPAPARPRCGRPGRVPALPRRAGAPCAGARSA